MSCGDDLERDPLQGGRLGEGPVKGRSVVPATTRVEGKSAQFAGAFGLDLPKLQQVP